MSPLNVHFRRKTFFEKSHELTYFSEVLTYMQSTRNCTQIYCYV